MSDYGIYSNTDSKPLVPVKYYFCVGSLVRRDDAIEISRDDLFDDLTSVMGYTNVNVIIDDMATSARRGLHTSYLESSLTYWAEVDE